MDEKSLIQRAASGDTAAFEQLVVRYQKQVYNLALRMVSSEQDAQDLAQEAFLRAWRSLGGFQYGAQFSTWLYRLTSNLCIDFLRAQKRRRVISLTRADEEEEQQWDMEDPAPTPEAQILALEDRQALQQAMAALNPEYRHILTLRVVQELSYQEIGEITGLKEGTVKSRLARAREQLRKNLCKAGNKMPSRSSIPKKGGASNVQ